MADLDASVWLGPTRSFFRKAMMVLVGATGLISFWLIAGRFFFGSEIGLKQFLHPGETPIVAVTMIIGSLAILVSAIYFSDTRGAIEIEPDGFFDIFSVVVGRITMFAVVTVVCVMFYEVVSRYVFNRPTLWANELSLWIAGFVFLLAGLYAMQQRAHIRIYIIYDTFPRWLQKCSDVLSVTLIWVFAYSMVSGALNESVAKFNRWETFGTAWDPPLPATMMPGILIIVILVSIQATSNLIADWHKAPESHTPMDDIDESEIANIRQTIED